MVERHAHPVVASRTSVNLAAAQVADPTVEVEDLGVVDIFSLTHDSTSLGGVVVLSHMNYLQLEN